jgi:hypothetical protein
VVVGVVKRIEKYIEKVKPLRIKGRERYGLVQVVVPREYVGKPAYVVVYVLEEEITSKDVARMLLEGVEIVRK